VTAFTRARNAESPSARDRGDDTEHFTRGFEEWPLLDMQFEIRGGTWKRLSHGDAGHETVATGARDRERLTIVVRYQRIEIG
jgi:hypothetical protein